MSRRNRDERRAAQAAGSAKESGDAGRTEGADTRNGEGLHGADGESNGAQPGITAATEDPAAVVDDRVPAVAPESEEPPAAVETGEAPQLEDAPHVEPDEDLSDLPEALQLAIVCFALKRDHVLEHRLTDDGVVIVTRGGRKLRWPGDEARAANLTAEDKDGVPRRDFPPANLFGRRG